MTVPTPVVVTQWVLLLGLASLVTVLYRQLAYLMKLREPPSADKALTVGERAPAFRYREVDALQGHVRGRFEPDRATLLAFADPHCGSCEDLMAVLNQMDWSRSGFDVDLLIATTAQREHLDSSSSFASSRGRVALVRASVATGLYRAEVTPYLFAIDARGTIRARGPARTRRDVLAILRSLERQREAGDTDAERNSALSVVHHGNPAETALEADETKGSVS